MCVETQRGMGAQHVEVAAAADAELLKPTGAIKPLECMTWNGRAARGLRA